MRTIAKISFLFVFTFIVNLVFATGTSDKEATATEGTQQQPGEKKQNTEPIDPAGELEGGSEPQELQSVDSTEDDSVSKYNFIFYYLYKLKYNESQNQEVEELF